MHVISRAILIEFWSSHADAAGPLQSWFDYARKANWASPAAVKTDFASASIINKERVVFNIKGDKYRLVVRVNHRSGAMFICFVGTHHEYDQIDPETVTCSGRRVDNGD